MSRFLCLFFIFIPFFNVFADPKLSFKGDSLSISNVRSYLSFSDDFEYALGFDSLLMKSAFFLKKDSKKDNANFVLAKKYKGNFLYGAMIGQGGRFILVYKSKAGDVIGSVYSNGKLDHKYVFGSVGDYIGYTHDKNSNRLFLMFDSNITEWNISTLKISNLNFNFSPSVVRYIPEEDEYAYSSESRIYYDGRELDGLVPIRDFVVLEAYIVVFDVADVIHFYSKKSFEELSSIFIEDFGRDGRDGPIFSAGNEIFVGELKCLYFFERKSMPFTSKCIGSDMLSRTRSISISDGISLQQVAYSPSGRIFIIDNFRGISEVIY